MIKLSHEWAGKRPGSLRISWRIIYGVKAAAVIVLLTAASPASQAAEYYHIQNIGALIGATGMDTLISMLERNERGLPTQAHTVMVEGIWNPGRTLRTV